MNTEWSCWGLVIWTSLREVSFPSQYSCAHLAASCAGLMWDPAMPSNNNNLWQGQVFLDHFDSVFNCCSESLGISSRLRSEEPTLEWSSSSYLKMSVSIATGTSSCTFRYNHGVIIKFSLTLTLCQALLLCFHDPLCVLHARLKFVSQLVCFCIYTFMCLKVAWSCRCIYLNLSIETGNGMSGIFLNCSPPCVLKIIFMTFCLFCVYTCMCTLAPVVILPTFCLIFWHGLTEPGAHRIWLD